VPQACLSRGRARRRVWQSDSSMTRGFARRLVRPPPRPRTGRFWSHIICLLRLTTEALDRKRWTVRHRMRDARPEAAFHIFLAVSLFDPGSVFPPDAPLLGYAARRWDQGWPSPRGRLLACSTARRMTDDGPGGEITAPTACRPTPRLGAVRHSLATSTPLRRPDACGTPELNLHLGPNGSRDRAPGARQKCFTLQPRDTPWATPTANRHLSPERTWATVGPAIGRGGYSARLHNGPDTVGAAVAPSLAAPGLSIDRSPWLKHPEISAS
jgi:hypothetical protein